MVVEHIAATSLDSILLLVLVHPETLQGPDPVLLLAAELLHDFLFLFDVIVLERSEVVSLDEDDKTE